MTNLNRYLLRLIPVMLLMVTMAITVLLIMELKLKELALTRIMMLY